MAKLERIKQRIHDPDLGIRERVLLCLSTCNQPAQVKDIKAAAEGFGLRKAKKWNFSRILSSLKGYAIRTPSGWELLDRGSEEAGKIVGEVPQKRLATATAASLLEHISKITDDETRSFVTEAVTCITNGCFRAAVVLTWSGAFDVLKKEVIDNHLVKFNAEALRRDSKWKAAVTADDLGRMKEFDFLNILESISVLGKNVKQRLEQCLQLRNGCGHPNSLKLAENAVAAHVEALVLNVFQKFCA